MVYGSRIRPGITVLGYSVDQQSFFFPSIPSLPAHSQDTSELADIVPDTARRRSVNRHQRRRRCEKSCLAMSTNWCLIISEHSCSSMRCQHYGFAIYAKVGADFIQSSWLLARASDEHLRLLTLSVKLRARFHLCRSDE